MITPDSLITHIDMSQKPNLSLDPNDYDNLSEYIIALAVMNGGIITGYSLKRKDGSSLATTTHKDGTYKTTIRRI